MSAGREIAGQGTSGPLRGTQSLVGVMSFVWKHPSLTGVELLWRWIAAGPMLWSAWHSLAPALAAIPLDTAALSGMTFFEPVRSAAVLARQVRQYLPAVEHTAVWWLPAALVVWSVVGAVGRSAVLRRSDRTLQPAFGRFAADNLLRAGAFLLLLLLWAWLLDWAVRVTVVQPGQSGGEPNIVLLSALAVGLTLLIFLAWSASVWLLDLHAVRGMTEARLHAPAQAQLRSKLMETNLVMGIVRVILLVLAMTFSASPLPFQSQQTQGFINVWWVGVAVFYVLASDFFHVVRRVTYLRLLQSVAQTSNAAARSAS